MLGNIALEDFILGVFGWFVLGFGIFFVSILSKNILETYLDETDHNFSPDRKKVLSLYNVMVFYMATPYTVFVFPITIIVSIARFFILMNRRVKDNG